MDNGWIKLHRKLEQWEWYRDSKTFHLFIHLLIHANHEPKKWRGIIIERGQLLTGRKALSVATGIGEQSIRTSLARLKSTNEITIQSTSLYSIITICNYNTYQDDKREINQVTNQQTNQQLTSDQPAANQRLTTNNNVNNVIIKEEKIKQGFDFEFIFKQYLNKDGKKQALKYFRSSVKTEADYILIQTALKNYLNSERVKNGYVKNASTWFNNWRDWIEPEKSKEDNRFDCLKNLKGG